MRTKTGCSGVCAHLPSPTTSSSARHVAELAIARLQEIPTQCRSPVCVFPGEAGGRSVFPSYRRRSLLCCTSGGTGYVVKRMRAQAMCSPKLTLSSWRSTCQVRAGMEPSHFCLEDHCGDTPGPALVPLVPPACHCCCSFCLHARFLCTPLPMCIQARGGVQRHLSRR